ncbi:LPXTG cell wall anchor domain-containing protein [Lactococcus lactis]
MPEKPTPPPEVTLPPAEKKEITPSPITVPNGGTQVVTLPATGDSSNKVYFVTALLFVAFIVLLFERMQKKLQKSIYRLETRRNSLLRLR